MPRSGEACGAQCCAVVGMLLRGRRRVGVERCARRNLRLTVWAARVGRMSRRSDQTIARDAAVGMHAQSGLNGRRQMHPDCTQGVGPRLQRRDADASQRSIVGGPRRQRQRRNGVVFGSVVQRECVGTFCSPRSRDLRRDRTLVMLGQCAPDGDRVQRRRRQQRLRRLAVALSAQGVRQALRRRRGVARQGAQCVCQRRMLRQRQQRGARSSSAMETVSARNTSPCFRAGRYGKRSARTSARKAWEAMQE